MNFIHWIKKWARWCDWWRQAEPQDLGEIAKITDFLSADFAPLHILKTATFHNCHFCHSSQSPPVASHHTQNERCPLSLCLISCYSFLPYYFLYTVLLPRSSCMVHLHVRLCLSVLFFLSNPHESLSLPTLIQMSLYPQFSYLSTLLFSYVYITI